MSNRIEDIREKLAYALIRINSLREELLEESKSNVAAQFVGQKTGEILAACRECFDYCAKDLRDNFLPNYNGNCYFPFSKDSLEHKFIKDLSSTKPEIGVHLSHLIDKIENNTTFYGTIFAHGILFETNKLVNDKKHDLITRSIRRDNSATHVKFGNGAEIVVSPMMPFIDGKPDYGADLDAMEMVGSDESVKINYIPEYRLTANNWEIVRYCWNSLESTWRALGDIYEKFLSHPSEHFNPHETIKPPAQREFEAANRRASPIITRLLRVALRDDDKIIKTTGLSFEGVPSSNDIDEIALGNAFLDIFLVYGWNNICHHQIDLALREHLLRYDRDGYKDRYCEIDVQLEGHRVLDLPNGRSFRFNSLLWGLGTRFQCTSSPLELRASPEEAWALARQVFGPRE